MKERSDGIRFKLQNGTEEEGISLGIATLARFFFITVTRQIWRGENCRHRVARRTSTHVLELNEVTVEVEGEALALVLKRFDCLSLLF